MSDPLWPARGKVGKSVTLRWLVERCQPPSGEDEDVRLWLNELADSQTEDAVAPIIDLGGGGLGDWFPDDAAS